MRILMIVLSIIFVLHLSAIIINIPTDQPTIQAGIDATIDGDTVLVQPGNYVENINYNGKNITVASLFLTTQDTTYISQTVIDGGSINSVVKFTNGENSTAILTGFTIINGSAWYGGGIYCSGSSNPSLMNLTITGNSAERCGGGIRCYFTSPFLQNVTIKDNSADWDGGGIYLIGSSLILTNVTITGNSAGWNGGGIYSCGQSNSSLMNVIVSGNSAGWNGGGINLIGSSLILTNVTITGNSAGSYGGGIYGCGGFVNCDPVDRCNIFLNFAGLGCDLYALYSSPINVIVDTFTVIQPDDYFAYSIDNFTFDILNSKIEQVDQDLYVSPDGSNENSGLTANDPLLTVSYALAKILANSNNPLTIHLSNGIYCASGTGEMFSLNCRSYVSLLGESDVSTILDGEGFTRIFFCDNDNNFSIENMTIRNGFAADSLGGGIHCNDSSPILQNIIISGNSADYGGGLYCYNSSPNLVDVTIIDNTSWGGGIYCRNNSSPSLENVTITGNSGGMCGGIYCYNSSPSLLDVTISQNSAYGSGISCWYNSNPHLENVTIIDNFGSGIGCYESSPILQNVTITGNTAYSFGGGLLCNISSPILNNVTIAGNYAEWGGGGIFCTDSSNPILANVTITGNSAYGTFGEGGGIWCQNNSSPSLVNCIMWNDTPQEVYFYGNYTPNSIIISYSDIQGGEAGIESNNNGTVNWLDGNINEDPIFVGTGDYPFSLQDSSPCVNAGIPDTTGLNLPEFDLAGNSRVFGNRIDMGAYENQNIIVNSDENLIPMVTKLNQNYPNPFNPATTISFSIPRKSNVELSVYNIKGQKVKQLVNETLQVGSHSVIWNGMDENNKPVSSGIYLYKLNINGKTEAMKKCLLLK